MPISDANRSALRKQRRQIAVQQAAEYEECSRFAREAMPHYSGDSYFESVIHALWFDLRGDVPKEWWEESILEAAYENFVEKNRFWLMAAHRPFDSDQVVVDELARLLVQTYRKISPAVLEKSDAAS